MTTPDPSKPPYRSRGETYEDTPPREVFADYLGTMWSHDLTLERHWKRTGGDIDIEFSFFSWLRFWRKSRVTIVQRDGHFYYLGNGRRVSRAYADDDITSAIRSYKWRTDNE